MYALPRRRIQSGSLSLSLPLSFTMGPQQQEGSSDQEEHAENEQECMAHCFLTRPVGT
jgi:hypothetical protein